MSAPQKPAVGNAPSDTDAIVIRWRNSPGWPIERVSDNASSWGIEVRLLERGACFADLMHPDDLARIENDMVKLPQAPERWHREYRFRCGEGWRWVEDHTWAERGANGETEAFNCVLFDVSQRKTADVGLSLAAASAPLLLGHAPLKARIAQLLRRLGEGFQVQRAFLFEFEGGTRPGNVSFQHSLWQRGGLTALRSDARTPITAAHARWIRLLENDQCIRGTFNEFPPIEREALRSLGIGSLIVVPIRCRSRLFGFLGLDDQQRSWLSADEQSLRMIATALGAAIERDRDEHELRVSESRLRRALDAAGAGTFEWRAGQVNQWSDAWYRMLGHAPGGIDASFDSWLKCVHEEDRERVGTALARARSERMPLALDYRIVTPDGDVRWLSTIGRPLDNADAHREAMAGLVLDVTEQRRALPAPRAAQFDALTGLPNRASAQLQIDAAIGEAPAGGQRFALLLLDLDRFRTINEGLGYECGDAVLCEVAQRLQRALGVDDSISHAGGDRFLILARSAGNSIAAGQLAERLLRELREPVWLAAILDVYVEASIGIALFDDDSRSTTGLLRCVDAALFHAKKAGGNGYRAYSSELIENARQKLVLDVHLRRALVQNEFVIHYQPIYDCRDERLIGVEALVRWRSPEGGLVMPGEFISAAEESGLIERLGDHVLETACRQVRRWRRSGFDGLRLSVNLSARQLRNGDFQNRLARILAETALEPNALELEITESLLMEHGKLIDGALSALREWGIRVAIDDFGTGYSSLAYLRRLPVDTLKIDRTFVADIGDESGDAIVGAVVALGQQLHLEVVAEGVETLAQLEFLRTRGCQRFQGHLKSPALPAAEFETRYAPIAEPLLTPE